MNDRDEVLIQLERQSRQAQLDSAYARGRDDQAREIEALVAGFRDSKSDDCDSYWAARVICKEIRAARPSAFKEGE